MRISIILDRIGISGQYVLATLLSLTRVAVQETFG
jgi:hypothetical protein